MPNYTLPPLKENDFDDKVEVEMDSTQSSGPDRWDRTITLPVNEEIMESLSVDDEARITLTGKVTAIQKNESSNSYSRRSIEIVISSIDAYPESEETADEDFANGFDKGHAKPYGR